ncbi:hypothetical protein DS884_06440 [Tenacibaculum sp. E3R01]|uniref:hypothetical protein n=1 Tax=Tenacibaculum sp. E3R01 TaxID=2267227 RepID=UPI000DE82855|nr:hypothetical protein [Tenacibaculum sp. E3R01]RBW59372.1 hypothetical protein DS884_06440 [Tenacibaculum sp. E3R01]
MELTKEQVQQINNFLEAIGVEYIDIRFEMVDHIASDIENKVSNIPAFYEDQRLHTHFLKYMLSRKKELKKRYDSILKKKFWSDALFILKDMVQQVIKPRNLAIISIVASISFYMNKLQSINTLYFPIILLIGYITYYVLKTREFIKTFGKLKIVHSYSLAGGIIINIAFQFFNLSKIGNNNGDWNSSLFNTMLISFFGLFLSGESFISKMNTIKEKYNYLIE